MAVKRLTYVPAVQSVADLPSAASLDENTVYYVQETSVIHRVEGGAWTPDALGGDSFVPDPAAATAGNVIRVSSSNALEYVDGESFQGADGEDGIGLPAGADPADAGKVPVFAGPLSSDYELQTPPAGVIEGVAGGAGFVNASGAITLDLSESRVFLFDVVGNVTSWGFTNAPTLTALSPVVRIVFRQDATGGRTITGGPSLTFRDRRSLADLNTTADAVNELHVWHDGIEWVAALIENGRLDLEPTSMSFTTNEAQLYIAPQAETLDLGNVTNVEADGTAGTGTLTYKKNGVAASGATAFTAGEVLEVTLASSTTASAVSIPRYLP